MSKRVLVSLGVAACFLLGMAVMAIAEGDDAAAPAKTATKEHAYVGSPKCKMCHTGAAKGDIYQIWEKSKHAQAFANLPDDNKTNATCLACHTTGYGKTGGYDPKAESTAGLEGVGCEACHGPGADYKGMTVMKDLAKAKEAGLIIPDATTCKGCHEGKVPEGHKALPKFDFAASYKLIEHHGPEK